MKTTFLTVKKKSIFAVLLCLLAIGVFCGTYFPIKANATPKPLHTIVIDAGHGGDDVKEGHSNFKNYKEKAYRVDMLFVN